MIYDTSANFSGVLHTATRFRRTCSKLVQSIQDATEMVDFIGRAPNGPIFDELAILRRNPRPQTRPNNTILRRNSEVVRSILQPEMKLPVWHKLTILEATEVEWVESSTITPP